MSVVVDAARVWIGTPYVHQASVRGAGCDCLGLIRGIWRDVQGVEPQAVPAYPIGWAEAGCAEALWEAAAHYFTAKPVSDAASGDVLLFRMRDGAIAKHLGVQTATGARPRFIHSYQGHGVIENDLTLPWARRIVARFSFPSEV